MKAKTVYTTEQGRVCAGCGLPVDRCECRAKKAVDRGDGRVRVGRETKGRKGKGVTVITGLPLHDDGLRQLARELKQRCGTGGTAKNGVIEIQGDHRDVLVDELAKRGYEPKRSGG